MSVRRLAAVQPESFTFAPETMAKAQWWIEKYPANRRQSAVIPLLWLVQKQEGWVSEPAISSVAKLLGMAQIRVFEVATFYTMFMLEPVGSAALIQVCKDKIGAKDKLSKDGLFTWQEVECLGACCNAPMAQINDYYYEDLTPENLAQIIDDFAAGKSPKPGPYNGRHTSEPLGGATTLSDPKLFDGSAAKKITIPNAPGTEAKPEVKA